MTERDAALGDDAGLVARVLEGEAEAFQELFSRYHRLVLGLAARLLNDRDEAADICQEVFLTVHRRLATLREPDKLRAWLCRITLTRVYNAERSFRRRFRGFSISLDDTVSRSTPYQGSHGDPERALVAAEMRRRLDAALAALPLNYRTVVVLRDIEGLSYDEIAEAIDKNLGTVKSRLARGREILRRSLHDLVRSGRETKP